MILSFVLLFPAHTRKSCRLRVSRTSCVLIFSYVNLSPYLITFGDGLRLHHASAMHDRIRSEKPNASFAVAWFPSSLQKSLLKVSLQKANKRVTTSVLFRAHTRNLSKYRSFRYSSAITGGTCRSLSPCDLGALLKSHLPSAFHPSLTARTFPQIRTVSASLSVGRSLKTSCKCTLFLTAFL